jgi:hypothetical protein
MQVHQAINGSDQTANDFKQHTLGRTDPAFLRRFDDLNMAYYPALVNFRLFHRVLRLRLYRIAAPRGGRQGGGGHMATGG